MTTDDTRKRGIEFLLSQKEKEKQDNELSAKELAPILGILQSSVYEHMQTLVDQGVWGMRYAFDPDKHQRIRVWWLIE
jgi:predicted ArsR family transcriptional regulator